MIKHILCEILIFKKTNLMFYNFDCYYGSSMFAIDWQFLLIVYPDDASALA